MRQKGNRQSDWSELLHEDSVIEKDLPKRGDKKWYDYIPVAQIKDLLPKLRYIRGSKDKIQFDGFRITSENNQSIFEKNHYFFASRSQVDRLAWYIGSKILEQIFLKFNGFKVSKLSRVMEEDVENYHVYDQMKIVKETFKKLVEKHVEGFVSDDELTRHGERFLAAFDDKNDKIKVGKILDSLVSEHGISQARDRLRKRNNQKFSAQALGIKEVSGETD